MKSLILILLIIFSCSSYANSTQKRFPNETFQQALNRIKGDHVINKSPNFRVENPAVDKKVSIKEIDYSLVPEVLTYDELLRMFYLIRDTRFLFTQDKPEFSRRISWLYPDDGCFARAALAGMKLKENKLIRPMKIFAFGDLEVQTPYSVDGKVYWWYHVAEVVRYMDAYYVLDPAMNSKAPLLADEWFQMMGVDSDLKGVVCNAYTYNPFEDCFMATEDNDRHAQSDQFVYLKKEWKRMSALGFDPSLVLGTNPPWL